MPCVGRIIYPSSCPLFPWSRTCTASLHRLCPRHQPPPSHLPCMEREPVRWRPDRVGAEAGTRAQVAHSRQVSATGGGPAELRHPMRPAACSCASAMAAATDFKAYHCLSGPWPPMTLAAVHTGLSYPLPSPSSPTAKNPTSCAGRQ